MQGLAGSQGMLGTPTPTWGSTSRRRGCWDLGPPPTLWEVISIFMRVGVVMNMLIRHCWQLQVPQSSLPQPQAPSQPHPSHSHSPG